MCTGAQPGSAPRGREFQAALALPYRGSNNRRHGIHAHDSRSIPRRLAVLSVKFVVQYTTVERAIAQIGGSEVIAGNSIGN